MRFINRETELSELAELEKLSKKKLFVVALYGLRRVGKTRLLLEFMKKRGLYFFVNKNKTSTDLLKEHQGILKEHGVLGEYETLDSWDKFVEVAIKRNPSIIVFDEFQNFRSVEPAITGMFQKNIDLNENQPGLIVLTGSLIGLMKDTFQNSKEPLYGRIKKGNGLEPLSLDSCFKIAQELSLTKEELVKIYGIFGGYPKYYVSIEDFALKKETAEKIIETLILERDAPLEREIGAILSQEFGGRGGMYYSILEAIANGNNTISSIAGYLNVPATSLTRQMKELKDYFELIEYEVPYRGKRGVYRIRHPLMDFWFGQIYRRYSDYAARDSDFIGTIKTNLNAIFGKNFERAAREFLISELKLDEAKRQWGKIPNTEKGKDTYEIDLIGTKGKKVFVFEFKWKKLNAKEASDILNNLKIKAKYVERLPEDASFGLIAKSVKEKKNLRDKGFFVYDIDDF